MTPTQTVGQQVLGFGFYSLLHLSCTFIQPDKDWPYFIFVLCFVFAAEPSQLCQKKQVNQKVKQDKHQRAASL